MEMHVSQSSRAPGSEMGVLGFSTVGILRQALRMPEWPGTFGKIHTYDDPQMPNVQMCFAHVIQKINRHRSGLADIRRVAVQHLYWAASDVGLMVLGGANILSEYGQLPSWNKTKNLGIGVGLYTLGAHRLIRHYDGFVNAFIQFCGKSLEKLALQKEWAQCQQLADAVERRVRARAAEEAEFEVEVDQGIICPDQSVYAAHIGGVGQPITTGPQMASAAATLTTGPLVKMLEGAKVALSPMLRLVGVR